MSRFVNQFSWRSQRETWSPVIKDAIMTGKASVTMADSTWVYLQSDELWLMTARTPLTAKISLLMRSTRSVLWNVSEWFAANLCFEFGTNIGAIRCKEQ